MASIIANEVFGDIERIARSKDALRVRSARACARIGQFNTDLLSVSLEPGVANKLRDDLRRKLDGAARSRPLNGDENVVFRDASDVLTGEGG